VPDEEQAQEQPAQPIEVLKRLLRATIKEQRELAGLTQAEAANRVLWSLSKIIRQELGQVTPSPADVHFLLDNYGSDREVINYAVDLATQARRPDPWSEFRDVVSPSYLELVSVEGAASIIMKYEPSLVPGLLQLESYARALLMDWNLSEEEINQLWRLRGRRQELLDREDCPELQFIVGEAAFCRPIGGEQVMREQIEHLKNLAKEKKIRLQLLPFGAGAHPGMGKSFTILQFRNPVIGDMLYLEDPDDLTIVHGDSNKLAKYTERFFDLTELALPVDKFASAVAIIADYRFRRAPDDTEG
jgi:transcriptional regulator with XRE-family HTH domain